MEKKPARVKVIPMSPNWRKEPGDVCKYAKNYGIKVELCGECDGETEGWDGYVYSHPAIGESRDAYESAEQCADAGMRALCNELAQDLGMVAVKRQTMTEARADIRYAADRPAPRL